MLRVSNIKVRNNLSDQEILEIAIKKYNIHSSDILDWQISKKSLDARNKEDIYYLYSIDLNVKDENKYKKLQKVKPLVLPDI